MAMHPSDDVDERFRRAARPDEMAVDRIARAALASVARSRRLARLIPVAALLVCLLALGAWWSHRAARTAATSNSSGDAILLQAPDGTTWIVAGVPAKEYLPPGTCVVIAAGETP
jgi:hypothetical protein